jgi:hypothetical protein
MRQLIRLAIVLALVMTACRAEINFVFDIDEDGGGEFAMEVGFDEEMLNLASLGAEGADPFEEMLGEFGTGDFEGATATRYTEGDMEYARWAIGFNDTDGLPTELFADGDPENPFQRLLIDSSDDGVRFEMDLAMPDATEDIGDAFDPSLITDDVFGFNIRVKLPGSVTDHNATKVLSDGSLQWGIPITGGSIDAYAQSSFGGGGIPAWVIVLIVVGVLAVGGVVLMALRRGKEEPAFDAATPAQGWDAPTPPADPFAAPPADIPETPPAGAPETPYAPPEPPPVATPEPPPVVTPEPPPTEPPPPFGMPEPPQAEPPTEPPTEPPPPTT